MREKEKLDFGCCFLFCFIVETSESKYCKYARMDFLVSFNKGSKLVHNMVKWQS